MFQKGITFLLFSTLFITGQLNAQEDKFSIGPRLGVNFANVSNVENTKSLTGLAIGLTSTYSINETSGLTFDLLYSGEGYKSGDDELKLNYLQIPIYFDVFFGEQGESFRPKVYAGFVPGFLLNAKTNDTELDKDQFNGFNFAFSGGLGFNYRVGSRIWLNTDLRAYLGLSDIRDDAFQVGDKVANNNVQLSLGLAYGLSKI
jgi:hypothetical protein